MDAWLDAVEGLALHALEDDKFDAGALQGALAGMQEPRLDSDRAELTDGIGNAWSIALYGLSSDRLAAAVAAALVARQAPQFSVWWTGGADATAVVVAGLPDPNGFRELMQELREAADAAPAQPAASSVDAQGAAAV
jgi:hypothetical protein